MLDTSESSIEGRVFLVGCPRSGTTLLQSLMAAHPAIASFPETHFFPTLIPDSRWRRLLRLASPEIRSWFERFAAEIGEELSVPPSPRGLFMASYVDAFTRLLDSLTQRRGNRLWIEKTPRHLHYIPFIETYLPDARFIHIVRNGRDVVASLYQVTHNHPEKWDGARSIEQCIDRWKRDVNRTRRYASQPHHTAVRYERLVEAPEAILRRLCDFLGGDYDPVMLDSYSKVASRVTREDEPWKEKTSSAIRSADSRKFHTVFSDDQQEYIIKEVSSFDLRDIPFE